MFHRGATKSPHIRNVKEIESYKLAICLPGSTVSDNVFSFSALVSAK